MREVNHLDVAIDTCTNCRGVWLDRGELEKIAAALTAPPMGAPSSFQNQAIDPRAQRTEHAQRPRDYPRDAPPERYRDDDDDDDHHRHSRSPVRKSKSGSFLDFFD